MAREFEPHVRLCADSSEPGACFTFCGSKMKSMFFSFSRTERIDVWEQIIMQHEIECKTDSVSVYEIGLIMHIDESTHFDE